MLRRFAKRLGQRLFGSHLFREAIRGAVLSGEFRDQLHAALLDLIRSPSFRDAISPHVFGLSFSPELQGMDPSGVASRVDRGVQLLLWNQYRDAITNGLPMRPLQDVGFRAFSPSDEDGILLYLWACLGIETRRVVEIGAGAGYDGLSANAIINHGFHALLIEADCELANKAKLFYETRPDTCLSPPHIVQSAVTSDTINRTISQAGFTGDIDLLSLDLDGLDYWVWKAITCVSPRLVTVKYHAAWGPDAAVTIPDLKPFEYSPDRVGYAGASLKAFGNLGRSKGYRLVGFNRPQNLAFFVRNDLSPQLFPAVPVEAGLTLDRHRFMRDSLGPQLKQWSWVEV